MLYRPRLAVDWTSLTNDSYADHRNRPRSTPIQRWASEHFGSEHTNVELAGLKMKVVDPNTSDREWHKRDNAEPGCRPVSLLSFLQAENIRLRRTVMELSLHAKVLREALKSMEAPNVS